MDMQKLLPALIIPIAMAAGVKAHAQDKYPTKPVRLIIGSAPGSGPDIISRLVSDYLYRQWNERVVVDSRPGVAGVISAELALRANPDGYTWMMLTSQLFVATSVFQNLKFNLDQDFESIALIGTVPFVQMVNPSLPVKSVQDLINYAKKNPGKLRYGSAGTGASEHLSGIMFTSLTGTQMLHVPYKGVAQAIADTIANEVQLTYAVMPAARGHVESGRLRAIGVTSPKRAPLLPNVPAIGEVVKGYSMLGWYSIVAPKGTPEYILNMVSKEVVAAAKQPAFAEKLKSSGVEIVAGDRKVLDDFRRDQRRLIGGLVKSAGISIKN